LKVFAVQHYPRGMFVQPSTLLYLSLSALNYRQLSTTFESGACPTSLPPVYDS
jgi:hypothetical protein